MPESNQPVEIPVTLNTTSASAMMDRLRSGFQSMAAIMKDSATSYLSGIGSSFTSALLAPMSANISSGVQGVGTLFSPKAFNETGAFWQSYLDAREQTAKMFQYGGTKEQILSTYTQLHGIQEQRQEGQKAAEKIIDDSLKKQLGFAAETELIRALNRLKDTMDHWKTNLSDIIHGR